MNHIKLAVPAVKTKKFRGYDPIAKATREAQKLHDVAYKVLVDTIEQEVSSKFDHGVEKKGQRAIPVKHRAGSVETYAATGTNKDAMWHPPFPATH